MGLKCVKYCIKVLHFYLIMHFQALFIAVNIIINVLSIQYLMHFTCNI